MERSTSLLDRVLTEVDEALRVVCAPARARTASPAEAESGTAEQLSGAERGLSARLMRVDHAGEVAAQALYRGQSLVARDAALRDTLLTAAREEHDHLAWCEQRVTELGSHASFLTPVWYGGSFVIGMLAGLSGVRTSLGFLGETERQVTRHLDDHLKRLPAGDVASRRILEKMREDEIRHGTSAMAAGGEELPDPVKRMMRCASRIMTAVAFRV